jgi:DNA repair exonuclease SbcCD nuclease subunit
MAKIAFCSDLHINRDLLRLTECLNFLDYLDKYCEDNQIEYIVIGGDLFDTSNNIRNQMFIPFFNKLFEIGRKRKLIIFPGNHDAMNGDNDCLAEAFKAFSHFIKKSETIEIDGVKYDFLAYTQNPDDIPNVGDVLFTHLEVEGFYFNPFKKCEDNTFTKGSFDNYDLVVSGHLHKKQEDGNIVFTGSPYSTRKDEAGHHYFAVIDGKDYELIEYDEAPDYMTVYLEEALTNSDIDYDNKIVEVVINSKIENFVKLRDIMISKGAVEVNARFEKTSPADESVRSKIDANEGVTVSMVKYLKETKKPGINNEKLLECFKEVLKRVKNS